MSRAQRGISRNTTARGSNANMFLTIVNSDCKSCQKRGKEEKKKRRKNPDRESKDTKHEVAQHFKLLKVDVRKSTLWSRLTSRAFVLTWHRDRLLEVKGLRRQRYPSEANSGRMSGGILQCKFMY